MTKRFAKTQMTQENWMNEEEPEEAGLFSVAAEAKLQGRVIRKAKRRNLDKDDKNGVPSTPFASFAGFVSTKSPSLPSYTFIQNNRTSNGESSIIVPKKDDLPKPSSPTRLSPKAKFAVSIPTDTYVISNGKLDDNTEYLGKLKDLNESFLGWVQEHMSKNAYCDFTPVCTDYMDHVQKLTKITTSLSPTKVSCFVKSNTQNSSIQLLTDTKTPPNVLKNNNSETKSSALATASEFSVFAQMKSTDSPKPFSFSSQVTVSKTEPSTTIKEDGDSYVPPKNEFEPVKETDALYSKRCKLFFKKGENYTEKGVGTLFLKELSEQIQLLIRADTSLGNILLNIRLTNTLPISRTGKNNVIIVCIPNPPLNPKETSEPTPLLFRVKTSQDADELFETLNKFKSGPKPDL